MKTKKTEKVQYPTDEQLRKIKDDIAESIADDLLKEPEMIDVILSIASSFFSGPKRIPMKAYRTTFLAPVWSIPGIYRMAFQANGKKVKLEGIEYPVMEMVEWS